MKHLIFGKKLGRDTNARKATLNSLASSVLEKGQIITTLTKAKVARAYVDKIITSAGKNDLQKRRKLASFVTPGAFSRLIGEWGPNFINRPGGYTRIIRLNQRRGDNAQLARLELLPLVIGKKEMGAKKTKTATARRTEKRTKSRKKTPARPVKSVVTKK